MIGWGWSGAVAAAVAASAVASGTVFSSTVFSFDDPRITESSGLVDLGSLMVTTNDSGGEPVVFVVDATSGRTVATTRFAPAVEDVEALAPDGPGSVWVGDIGDNLIRRDSIQVYRVPVGEQSRTVQSESYELVYPDGPHDAESLVYGPDGRLRIITKSLLGGRVYVAAKDLDPGRPNKLAAGPLVDLWATDAALFPDGRHALVRGYGGALVTTFPGFRTVAALGLPDQEQGEGVSIGRRGRIRLSSEGRGSDVLQIRLPADIQELLRASPAQPVRTGGIDADGVLDADDASGLSWPWVGAVGVLGALLGWLLVRRRPGR